MESTTIAETPHIELTPVESSQIAAIGHDPATNTLAIQFKGKGDRPGSIYHYDSDVAVKLPKAAPPEQLFFPDEDGNPTRTPTQRQRGLGLGVNVN